MLSRLSHWFGFRRGLSVEEVRLVQAVAEQVVLSLEISLHVEGPRKKELAVSITSNVLTEAGIRVPPIVIETAIEASVCLMKLFERHRVAS